MTTKLYKFVDGKMVCTYKKTSDFQNEKQERKAEIKYWALISFCSAIVFTILMEIIFLP